MKFKDRFLPSTLFALKYLAFIGILLISFNTFSQKTIISGKVIDADTKEPLPFVNIVFQNSKVGTSSDLDGNYKIETYYGTDSLIATFLGYKAAVRKVRLDKTQQINFELKSGDIQLKEVVIKYKGNPAHIILDRVKRNKKANNREKYDYYEYEVYNKVEFDLNNITEDFKNKKVFKNFQFIFDYVDTTEEKEFLPMFMTESVSDFYYKRTPKSEREYIKASKISGTSNESVTKFLGDMYQKVNIYDNYVSVFGKSFVSPISDNGLSFYRYYLKDSLYIDGKFCFEIEFIPKHRQDPVFDGVMWIADTTYAVKRIKAGISENANINFINGFEVEQEYTHVENKFWMLEKDKLKVDFQLGENVMGMYGRKFTSYRDFKINQEIDEEYFEGIDNVNVAKDANIKTEEYWQEARHDSLSANQLGIYEMVDSVKNVPAFKTFLDIIQLAFTGYKEVGLFEIGPYFNLYSYNPVEGSRFRFGGRTSNEFSTRIMFNGYLAYGTLDERFKYNFGFLYKLNDIPRTTLNFQYKRDVEQLGLSQNAFSEDNILSSFLRRNPNDKLTDVQEVKTELYREWITGFSNTLILKKRQMSPLGSLKYQRFDPNPEVGLYDDNFLNTTEIGLHTRFAYKETFLEGEFERISLGTKYPILEFQVGFGFKDLLDGDYTYQKMEIAISDGIKLGVYGNTRYRLTAGKYFGTLPYPLLEIHNGNESYFYDRMAFNLMNFFEFVSDQYATFMIEHHFDGYFLNKMPLFRKLKWREVLTYRAVTGSLEDKNKAEMVLPSNIYELTAPYMEVAAGIENIFKVLRVDVMWRLNYLDHPDIAKFGIRAAFEFSF